MAIDQILSIDLGPCRATLINKLYGLYGYVTIVKCPLTDTSNSQIIVIIFFFNFHHGHLSSLSYLVSDTCLCQCPTPTRHPYYILYFGHYRCSRVRVMFGVCIGASYIFTQRFSSYPLCKNLSRLSRIKSEGPCSRIFSSVFSSITCSTPTLLIQLSKLIISIRCIHWWTHETKILNIYDI